MIIQHESKHKNAKNIPYHLNDNNCWICDRGKDSSGYAYFYIKRKMVRIHRYMYEKHIGIIPKGMCVCHKCDTPACINPEHLFIGTHYDNMQDKKNKKRNYNGYRKGTKHPLCKLKEKDVLEIRESNLSSTQLSKIYKVSRSQILNIKNRKRWNHI